MKQLTRLSIELLWIRLAAKYQPFKSPAHRAVLNDVVRILTNEYVHCPKHTLEKEQCL